MDKNGFTKRAAELRELAKARGIEGLEGLNDLPEDDPVAEIGFLASKLGLDFGLAFDTEAAFKEGV